MFQFSRLPPYTYFIQYTVHGHYSMWVPPFGNLRIKGYLRLPAAYRSLSRPSSATGAKASSLRSFMLNLCEHPSGHSIVNHVSATVLLSCLSSFEFLRIIRHLLVFLPLWLKLFLLPHYNFLPCSFPTYCCLLILHLIIQFSRYIPLVPEASASFGGLKWSRTTDLALIRRAL